MCTVDVTDLVDVENIFCVASVLNMCRHLQRICVETVRYRQLVRTWSNDMTSYDMHMWGAVCTYHYLGKLQCMCTPSTLYP
jgi:hypothetical protein